MKPRGRYYKTNKMELQTARFLQILIRRRKIITIHNFNILRLHVDHESSRGRNLKFYIWLTVKNIKKNQIQWNFLKKLKHFQYLYRRWKDKKKFKATCGKTCIEFKLIFCFPSLCLSSVFPHIFFLYYSPLNSPRSYGVQRLSRQK